MIDEIIKMRTKYVNYIVNRKYLTKDEAEDLFQDALLVCAQKDNYDIPWFVACLNNKIKCFIRDKIAENTTDINMEYLPEKREFHHIKKEDVLKLFSGLAKDIVELRLEGYTFKEISKKIDKNESNIRTVFINARNKISKEEIERIKNG